MEVINFNGNLVNISSFTSIAVEHKDDFIINTFEFEEIVFYEYIFEDSHFHHLNKNISAELVKKIINFKKYINSVSNNNLYDAIHACPRNVFLTTELILVRLDTREETIAIENCDNILWAEIDNLEKINEILLYFDKHFDIHKFVKSCFRTL